ncbi:MAG: hypothetical protein ACK501_01360 [Planctomycetota bacterium]|jgi:epoxyqueuosine reductase
MRSQLLPRVQDAAARCGLNLFGLVDAVRFDSCSPCEQRLSARMRDCGTIVVLGSGGRQLAQQFQASRTNGSPAPTPEAFALAGLHHVAAELARHGVRNEVVELPPSPRWNTGRLGECAGFGTVSPVSGLLLHPTYGPWLRLHGVVLVEGRPFGEIGDASISDHFQPCSSCSRPCVTACPAGVHDGHGHQDVSSCASHRQAGGCEDLCASRSACPLGSEHRDASYEHVHRHAYQLATLQRWFGYGVWRIVPAFLRHGR